MSATSTGRLAEQASAKHLESLGFKLQALNWRNRRCEIDIVAEKSTGVMRRNKVIHFVEVKFRKSNNQGSGLDYITKAKLKQMDYAAQNWVYENDWHADYQLDVVSVTRTNEVWEFELIENVSLEFV